MSCARASVLACPMLLIAGCGSGSGHPTPVAAQKPRPVAARVAHPSQASLAVRANEFSFAPHAIVAKAGKLKITLRNKGHMTHELILLQTNRAAGSLRVRHGRVSESASVGEISETRAGKTASHTFTLKPGHYVMVCNVRGHYHHGMRGRLTVR
jgi:uncharacterized cupredoxin-like copper-binding protein